MANKDNAISLSATFNNLYVSCDISRYSNTIEYRKALRKIFREEAKEDIEMSLTMMSKFEAEFVTSRYFKEYKNTGTIKIIDDEDKLRDKLSKQIIKYFSDTSLDKPKVKAFYLFINNIRFDFRLSWDEKIGYSMSAIDHKKHMDDMSFVGKYSDDIIEEFILDLVKD